MKRKTTPLIACATAFVLAGVMSRAGERVDAERRHIEELVPTTSMRLGKTADWVAVTEDAVWVGSTGPNAVSQIDPRTNALVATVRVPGEPCAGLAVGHGG